MRKYIWVIICCVVAVFFSVDKTVLKNNIFNDVFRIDIVGENADNSIEMSPSVTDLYFKIPSWCKDCWYGRGDLIGGKKDATVKFKVTKNDTVIIMLRGEHLKQDDKKIPLFIDYSGLIVNGKPVFSDKTSVWHDASYKYKMNLKSGDIVEFTVHAEKSSLIKSLPYCRFHFWRFLIIFCCLCFLAKYISKYADKKGYNKIDFIFVIMFAILLFIPMMRISNVDKSDQENRMLATKPSLIVNNDVNEKYGTQFNAWFNDRFFGRDALINLYTGLKFDLSAYVKTNGLCINKKDKWVGRCGGVQQPLSNQELEHIVKNIERLKKFARTHNMKFYLVVAPSQGSVYGKKVVPFWQSNEYEQTQQITSYIKQHTNIDVIYPYEEMLEKSKYDQVYFKTDTHWNDVGAFVAYNQIMRAIQKDFKNIKILNEDDFDYFYSNKVKVERSAGFHNGSEYRVVGLKDVSFLQEKYKYFIHKKHDKLIGGLKIDPKEEYTRGVYEFKWGGRYNLTLFGDSFGENLMSIIPYNFKKTLRIYTGGPVKEKLTRNLDFSRFEKQVLDNKTDVLVFVVSGAYKLMYLYKD